MKLITYMSAKIHVISLFPLHTNIESIFYLGTTNFLGGSFFIENHKNPSGGTPTSQKKWRFWSKTCFFRALNNFTTS